MNECILFVPQPTDNDNKKWLMTTMQNYKAWNKTHRHQGALMCAYIIQEQDKQATAKFAGLG